MLVPETTSIYPLRIDSLNLIDLSIPWTITVYWFHKPCLCKSPVVPHNPTPHPLWSTLSSCLNHISRTVQMCCPWGSYYESALQSTHCEWHLHWVLFAPVYCISLTLAHCILVGATNGVSVTLSRRSLCHISCSLASISYQIHLKPSQCQSTSLSYCNAH
jgi:hypothetical protein